MSKRREFLKQSVFLGAAGLMPLHVTLDKKNPKKSPSKAENLDTYAIELRSVMNIRPIQPRQITIPDTGGFKVLKGDFHMHTLFSDGKVMPGDRVNEAVQNGLDVIAITDHIEVRPFFSNIGRWRLTDDVGGNFNISYDAAKPEADRQNLLLIRGTEITKGQIPPGHFNALFCKDINPIAAVVDDWRKMLQVAADQGCFLIWNHPGWEYQLGKGIPLKFFKEHKEVWEKGWMHGIEVFNGSEYYPAVSDWCNEKDLALFSNSDIHLSEFNSYGLQNPSRPITLVLAKERTVESIREAMFARRTIAWGAGILWGRDPWLPELFNASVNIKVIRPGRLEMINNSSLPITVSVGGTAFNLPENTKQQVYRTVGVNELTVTNWMIGTNKPLKVPLKGV